MANRLAHETSPYLLQHAENPVDWYPWGEEAFERARAEDRAVLVSIGYSACHWCHVMERECFEDERIAQLMNERFVCIKVDREEHPDVDAIYMDAVQAMTGAGRLAAERLPHPRRRAVLGRHLLPARAAPGHARAGRRCWPRSAPPGTSSARRSARRPAASSSACAAPPRSSRRRRRSTRPRSTPPSPRCASSTTPSTAGSARAPKFPPTSAIEFLLGRGEREMALHTLRRMASGGMYDQIGGGFARYSVDRFWLVPHFEKMLYDNALLARAYLHAWQVTGEPLFERVCRETLDWALAELRQEEGAFASALDADAEGVEGKFTVWTLDEVRAVLGDELGAEAIEHFGMTEGGNFEGRNIPVRATPDPPHREELRKRLYEARAKRVWPGLDDKRLTGWNALMVSALADAGAVLDEPLYRDAAVQCADFLVTRMRDDEGRLLRTYNRGQARLRAVLEDHAFLLEALLTLYEATFDPRWFAEAQALADTILERFHDPENGGFFSTADDHEQLIARRKDIDDNPIPAGPVGRLPRPAAARRADRRAPLRGGGARRDPAPARDRAAAPGRLRPSAAGDRLPRLPRARGRPRRAGPRAARARGALDLPPARRARRRRARRRAAAGGARAGRRPRGRLRVRALRLPAAGDGAGGARGAAGVEILETWRTPQHLARLSHTPSSRACTASATR